MNFQWHRHESTRPWARVLILAVGLPLAGQLQAQDSGLSWFTIDAGGGRSIGGPFAIAGSIGQPESGELLSGGEFALVGGFIPGTSTAPPCPGDLDGDDDADLDDLTLLLQDFGCTGGGCSGDLDGDGDTDLDDLTLLLQAFGTVCP
jgi:hypothetical protein